MSSPFDLPTPAGALWNQREWLAARRERFRALSAAVNAPIELALFQWAQLSAFALEFRPALILELGRRRGNSTCAFLEVAHQLGGRPHCRLLSLCLSDDWMVFTVPRLKPLVPPGWFDPADIRVADILGFDFAPALASAPRVLVFWDAHGFDLAECVLGRLLPLLADRPHAVLMHDLSDLRFDAADPSYAGQGLWKGTAAAEPSLWLGHIFSRVAQSISVVDFTSRNRIPLRSAAESLHLELGADPSKREALAAALGEQLFSLQAHWFWFSLNEAPGALTFPRFAPPEARAESDAAARQAATARGLAEQIDRIVASLRQPGATPPSAAEQLEGLSAALRQALACLEEELALLRTSQSAQAELLDQMRASAAWRFVSSWRSLRQRLAPAGTARGRFYEGLVRRFFHSP